MMVTRVSSGFGAKPTPRESLHIHRLVKTSGLLTAQQWFADDRVDAILLGVVDEYCSVLGYCWERYFGSQHSGSVRPLDFARTQMVAGEGSAFFLLQPENDAKPKYGSINRVEMGNLSGSCPEINIDHPLILGCEGNSSSGSFYRQHITEEQPVACYTPLYGASPVTQGFDLAVAALAMQRQQLFPSADNGGDYYSGSVAKELIDCRQLSCLRFGMNGEYAAIHLNRE